MKKKSKRFIRNAGSAMAKFIASAFKELNKAHRKDVLKQNQAPK